MIQATGEMIIYIFIKANHYFIALNQIKIKHDVEIEIIKCNL